MAPQQHDPELRVTGVTKRFGGVVAAANVSLTVTPGRIRGLIGPNGAGKSTLLGVISGFIRPDTGNVSLGDRGLVGLRPTAIARLGVARTFQQATPLRGLTVIENLMVGMHASFRQGPLSVLLRTKGASREETNSHEHAHSLLSHFGLEVSSSADASDLAFGNLRLLEVARSAASRPRIMLLDEPAAGLNRVEADRLAKLILELKSSGVGVLVVDHDMPFVFGLCDDVTVMNFGQIIADAPSAEVFRDPEVRKAYLGTVQPAEDA